jgi:hypothetical protein
MATLAMIIGAACATKTMNFFGLRAFRNTKSKSISGCKFGSNFSAGKSEAKDTDSHRGLFALY